MAMMNQKIAKRIVNLRNPRNISEEHFKEHLREQNKLINKELHQVFETMHVLLVEPAYYTRYPPLGLLKLASYHRKKKDEIKLVRGCKPLRWKPDRVYVASLFTWAWKPVWDAVRYYKAKFRKAEVWLGGLYASLLPDHARLSGADHVHVGLFEEAENYMPAYDLVPEWDGSIIFASRGCNNHCPYCAVWRLEGGISHLNWDIKHFIYPKHTRVIFWDNNILQAPNWRAVSDELIKLSKERKIKVDFNQGLDARLITDEVAEKLSKMNPMCIRLAYDHMAVRKSVRQAIEIITSHGIRGRKVFVYTLYNWKDGPEDLYKRMGDILNWGAVVFPMRYEPLDSLERNSYISPKWDGKRLNQVEKFRRVVGFAGTFPPYNWLRKRFNKATCFDKAFQLPPRLTDNLTLKRAHKSYCYGRWGQPDWRCMVKKSLAKQW